MKTLKENFFGNLGIGKKAKIEEWLKKYNIKKYIINPDFTIDVHSNVTTLYRYPEKEFPEYIQFNKIFGEFGISYSNLTTLRGCPKEIEEDFYCSGCKNLTSLEYCPEIVGGSIYISENKKLESLQSISKTFNSLFCIGCENLKSLKGCPKKILGTFDCSKCYNLKSLIGCPIECSDFICYYCKNLKSLKGCPKLIEDQQGYFDCSYCLKLDSLEYLPKYIPGDLICYNCKKIFTGDDIKNITIEGDFKNVIDYYLAF